MDNFTINTNNLEHFIDSSKCYEEVRLKNASDTNLNYYTCPEYYDNSTERVIIFCCINFIINQIENSLVGKLQYCLAYYSSSILVLPAIIFNIFSLFILSRFSKLNSIGITINYYMKYLCIFDTLTIISKFIYECAVVRNVIRKDPLILNSLICKLTHFSESAFGITSIYLLVLMTVDKLFYVAFPLSVSSYLKPKRANLFCALTFLFSTSYSLYHVFSQDIQRNSVKNSQPSYNCINTSNIEEQMRLADIIIRIFLPISLLCLLNFTIIYLLSRPRKSFSTCENKSTKKTTMFLNRIHSGSKKNEINSLQGDNSPAVVENLLESNKICKSSINPNNFSIYTETVEFDGLKLNSTNSVHICCNCFNRSCRKNVRNQDANIKKSIHFKHKKKFHYTSMMLLTVTFGFVIFNLPFAIKTLFELNFNERFISISNLLQEDENGAIRPFKRADIMKHYNYELMVYISHFLLDLNYVVNFFFYLLSGSRFRNRVRNLIFMKCE